ncbi:hypothetical protein [Planctomicrobium sp. SH527]|uniref:hypothetical protein n=1 Tax=Planctomicrobium sp. SH527 TaxID=3448123 RepID=UPI003F5C4059
MRQLFQFGICLLTLCIAVPCLAQVDSNKPSSPPTEQVHRTIYVPFKNLEKAIETPDSQVVLPYSSYQELLNQIKVAESRRVGPGAVLTKATYVATADETSAKITAKLGVESLKDGAVLPLEFGDAAIGSLTAPEGILLQATGTGTYALIIPKAGSHSIQLELVTRINQSPSGREISLNCPVSPVTELEITVPQANQTIDVAPKGVPIVSAEAAAENVTNTKVAVGATSKIQVRWHASASNAPEMNLLASVKNQTLITIADGQIHTRSWLTYDVMRGEMNQVRVALPANMRLLDVRSASRIQNWKVQKREGSQIVTIDLLQAANKQFSLELDAEEKLESNEIVTGGITADGKVLGIQPMDVVRVSGMLAIHHGQDLSVNASSPQGLVRIDASEANPELRSNSGLLYRYFTADHSLSLSVQPVLPRIQVNQNSRIYLQSEHLTFTEKLDYKIERIGIFGLTIKLADDVTIDQVTGRNVKSFNVQDGLLSVQFNQQTMGSIDLLLTGRMPLENTEGKETPLPISSPEGVERDEGTVFVYAKDSVEVQTPLPSVQSAQPIPIADGASEGDFRLTSAWRYYRRPVVIPVRLQRKPARILAEIATTIDIQQEVSRVKSLLTYSVELSPVNTFRFEVPESISNLIRIDVTPGNHVAVPIRQKTAAEPVDGRVVWTIATQRELIGKQTFTISYDLPTTVITDKKEADNAVTFPLPRPLGIVNNAGEVITPIASLIGEISVQKDRTLSLVATPSSSLEQIDNRELTLLPHGGTLAYQYYRDDADAPASLEISTRRYEIQNVVSTIISRGLVEVVASQDPQATFRCRYVVQTTERQRLLVALPAHLEVLGTFLNDREVKLEKAEVALPDHLKLFSPYWLNIARPDSSESSFLLTFQFLWNLNPSLGQSRFGSGDLHLPLPVIDVTGNGVVQEQKVLVWIPEKYALIGHPAPFRMQTISTPCQILCGQKPDRNATAAEAWVLDGQKAPAGISQFPTNGRLPYIYNKLGQASSIEVRWWNRLSMTILFSVAAALIGWILVHTSWENRLGILLFFTFAAALYGLYDNASLNAAVSAGKYGLVVMILIWVLHAVLGRPTPVPPTKPTPPADEPPAEASGDGEPLQPETPPQPAT